MKRRRARCVLTAVALLACALPAYAVDPAYLAEWPAPERVLTDFQGQDPQDTMARQMAALSVLRLAIEDRAGPRRWHGLTPDEGRLRGDYFAAEGRIRGAVNSTLSSDLGPGFHGPFAKSPLGEWNALEWKYAGDPQFRVSTLSRYLSPETVSEIEAQIPETDPRSARAAAKRSGVPVIPTVLGLVVLLGIVVQMIRTFRRRSREDATPAEADDGITTDTDRRWSVEQQREFEAAAVEVLDSLEPYIAAARVVAGTLPWRVFADAQIMGFLQIYCDQALALIRATDAKQIRSDETAQVVQRLFVQHADRLGRLFGGPIPGKAESMNSPERKRLAMAGAIEASIVLRAFHPKTEMLDMWRVDDSKLGGLQVPTDAKPTRLHPDSPRAETAQRMLVYRFSKRLVAVAGRVEPS